MEGSPAGISPATELQTTEEGVNTDLTVQMEVLGSSSKCFQLLQMKLPLLLLPELFELENFREGEMKKFTKSKEAF